MTLLNLKEKIDKIYTLTNNGLDLFRSDYRIIQRIICFENFMTSDPELIYFVNQLFDRVVSDIYEKLKVGDFVTYNNRAVVYKIVKIIKNENGNFFLTLLHSNKSKYYQETKFPQQIFSKLNLNDSMFEILPPESNKYPDNINNNPLQRVIDLPNEIWFPILNYENYYEISNKGRVKSLRFKGFSNNHGLLSLHEEYWGDVIPFVILSLNGEKQKFDIFELAKSSMPKLSYDVFKLNLDNELKNKIQCIKNNEDLPAIDIIDLVSNFQFENIISQKSIVIFQVEGIYNNKSDRYIKRISFSKSGNTFFYTFEGISDKKINSPNSKFHGKVIERSHSSYETNRIKKNVLITAVNIIIEAPYSYVGIKECIEFIKNGIH